MSRKNLTKAEIQSYTAELSNMSNSDLLEEVYWFSNATSIKEYNSWEVDKEELSKKELEKRLREIGFLKDENNV
jgi:hypothetical protein